jgi:hypothetical protein
MILINFGPRLKPIQIAQLEACSQTQLLRTINFTFDMEGDQAILNQFKIAVGKLILKDVALDEVVVNLPAQNYLSVLIMVELYRRLGYFPKVLRTRFRALGIMPYQEIVEVLDVQEISTNS